MNGQVAPAKVNLFLHVLGRRADGYHALESLVAFTDFGDELTVEPREDGCISLAISGPFSEALKDEPPTSNLAYRAASALAEAGHVSAGVSLRLDKRLPVAAGLGGGSADAAATLRLLAHHWQVELGARELDRLAYELGADVPVCLRGVPSVVGGAGERVQPLSAFPALPLVLVNPGVPLATGDVFAMLTPPWSPARRAPERVDARRELLDLLGETRNDLEAAAISLAPAIGTVLDCLQDMPGCRLARMSGSGATCFGLFDESSDAAAAAAALSSRYRGWWIQAGALVGAGGTA